MATPMIRATYTFQSETISHLEWLAHYWKMPKSEALRKVVDERAVEEMKLASTPLAALQRLQKKEGIEPSAAARWIEEIRQERDASIDKLEKTWASYTSTPTT